jgi:hypothetical protein
VIGKEEFRSTVPSSGDIVSEAKASRFTVKNSSEAKIADLEMVALPLETEIDQHA